MKASIKTIMDGVVHDNREVIKENGGNVAEYLITDTEAQDQGWLWFMTDEEAEEYENASAERREEMRTDIRNWINENYNYTLRSEELLEKWIVVQILDADPTDAIRVTRRSNFEKMSFCNAYGNYGVQVDCNNAGCYTFSNSESSIFLDFSKKLYGAFPGSEAIVDENEMTDKELAECFIDSYSHKSLKDMFGEEFGKMLEFFNAFRKENETHTEVTGWTFHDSHNFRTVISECDFGEPDCVELDEEDQIEILLQMPETAPHIDGTNASEETEDYIFHFDRWATNPWFCCVERK